MNRQSPSSLEKPHPLHSFWKPQAEIARPISISLPPPKQSETTVVGSVYAVTLLVGSLTIGLCGPGGCFVFFSILAGVSGLLMLRSAMGTRVIGLAVLLFSLVQMGFEKEERETWSHRAQRRQIETLQQQLADRGTE